VEASRNRDVIVVGASAGGVEALRRLAAALPRDLPAAVFVVVHGGTAQRRYLAELLAAAGPLPAVTAEEGMPFAHGRFHVAAPGCHLLVGQDHVHVRRGPKENRTRPAIDPLFRSAAVHCSTRVIGVVLTGMLDDGTAGLKAIRRCGGLAVVQDPADADWPDMPRSALAHAGADHVLPLAEIGGLLARLARETRPPPVEAPDSVRAEALIAAQELTMHPDQKRLGELSPLTCPDCHGTLDEIDDNGFLRFRCHTGHAFTAEALRAAQSEAWERALYSVLRTQEEQSLLTHKLASDAKERGALRSYEFYELRAQEYEEGAEIVRRLLARGQEAEPDPAAAEPRGGAA
jgi:two-component system, chemotaxis family, protein-glutamate methylesterase/glutaminase